LTTDKLDEPYRPDLDLLDPAAVRVEREPGEGLRLTIGDNDWTRVEARLLFPLTPTEKMVAFLDSSERLVGTIRSPDELEPSSARVLEEELREQYFRPVILKISRLVKRLGLIEMETLTDAGPRLIRFRSAREDIRELNPGRFLLTDAAGDRYELPCLDALDNTSKALWHNLV
jgi:hypothetical protein